MIELDINCCLCLVVWDIVSVIDVSYPDACYAMCHSVTLVYRHIVTRL